METTGLTLTINGTDSIRNWTPFGEHLREGSVSLSGSPIRQWTISAGNGLDKEVLDDLLVLLRYNLG